MKGRQVATGGVVDEGVTPSFGVGSPVEPTPAAFTSQAFTAFLPRLRDAANSLPRFLLIVVHPSESMVGDAMVLALVAMVKEAVALALAAVVEETVDMALGAMVEETVDIELEVMVEEAVNIALAAMVMLAAALAFAAVVEEDVDSASLCDCGFCFGSSGCGASAV